MEPRTDQEEIRRKRRSAMLERRVSVYPARLPATAEIAELRRTWSDGRSVSVVGRVRAIRLQGSSAFVNIDDGTTADAEKPGLQIFIQEKNLGTDYTHFTDEVDIGDFVGFQGTTFVTKRGEKTVDALKMFWAAKTLRPIPSTRFGVEDDDLRYRHRELELMTDPNAQKIFRARADMVAAIRKRLTKTGFMEVETPVLQTLAGGATAKPFVTHHNALNIDLYLRIAPELYLKRLIVGGFNRVYEIARCFRNEGIDRDHNPEFTQVELYAAYKDYRWLMSFTEKLVTEAVVAVNGKPQFMNGESVVAVPKKFPRISYRDVIKQHTADHIDINDREKVAAVGAAMVKEGHLTPGAGFGKIVDEIFKMYVRPKLIEPIFVYDYPVELSPLAKRKEKDGRYAERFQLLMGGTEIGNAFSELNDPIDQRARFEEQEALRKQGDDEAQRIDENFIQALEYGMPPTAGLGLGLDRLISVLTNTPNVKNVILFPVLRPKS